MIDSVDETASHRERHTPRKCVTVSSIAKPAIPGPIAGQDCDGEEAAGLVPSWGVVVQCARSDRTGQ